MTCTMAFLLVVANFTAEGTSPWWFRDYAEARDAAVAFDRPLLVLICDGSSYYGKMATQIVFISNRIERTLQDKYARLYIDTETEEGRVVASQFGVERGPYWV